MESFSPRNTTTRTVWTNAEARASHYRRNPTAIGQTGIIFAEKTCGRRQKFDFKETTGVVS
jgi:hypothetical protein